MIEKRTFTICYKVIRTRDIRNIANNIYDIYNKLLSEHNDAVKNKTISAYTSKPSVAFHVNAKDYTEYSTDNLDMFQPDGILDNKVLTNFSCRVNYYEQNLNASLSLANTQFRRYESSGIEVQDSNSEWVNATFQKLQDCVSTWEIQDSKIKKYRWPISITLASMLAWFFGTILYYILSFFISGLKSSYLYLIPIFTVFVALSWISWPIANYLSNLWPDIEFIPGPEHERTLTRKRGGLKWLFSVVIIPFIIAVITTLIFRP